MTSFSTTVEVYAYRAEEFGAIAFLKPTADAPIDVRLETVFVDLTEDAAPMFQKGRRLKVTFEPEEEHDG